MKPKPYRLTIPHALAALASSAAALAATPASGNPASTATATAGTPAAAPFQHPPLGTGSPHRTQSAPKVKPVNLNTASRAELVMLPGIGPGEADRIIKARPYFSKAKLLAENVIPAPLYDGLRGRVFAGPAPGLKAPQAPGRSK